VSTTTRHSRWNAPVEVYDFYSYGTIEYCAFGGDEDFGSGSKQSIWRSQRYLNYIKHSHMLHGDRLITTRGHSNRLCC
jgi:hypothetical protein